jgi:hypothetical protein
MILANQSASKIKRFRTTHPNIHRAKVRWLPRCKAEGGSERREGSWSWLLIQKAAFTGGFLLVRPAWAPSWRCKSSREQAIAIEVKRSCGRATDRGEEAWSVTRGWMDKNRIGGDAGRGERANDREAPMVKVQAA